MLLAIGLPFPTRRLLYDSQLFTAAYKLLPALLFENLCVRLRAKRLRWIDSGFIAAGFGRIPHVVLHPTALILVSLLENESFRAPRTASHAYSDCLSSH